MLASHPYEQPAYDIIELADPGVGTVGTGRIGLVEPTTLRDFAQVVAEALPATEQGARVSGDPERVVRRVAVCGGAGDFLLERPAGRDADGYLPSDQRPHLAAGFGVKGGPGLGGVGAW